MYNTPDYQRKNMWKKNIAYMSSLSISQAGVSYYQRFGHFFYLRDIGKTIKWSTRSCHVVHCSSYKSVSNFSRYTPSFTSTDNFSICINGILRTFQLQLICGTFCSWYVRQCRWWRCRFTGKRIIWGTASVKAHWGRGWWWTCTSCCCAASSLLNTEYTGTSISANHFITIHIDLSILY